MLYLPPEKEIFQPNPREARLAEIVNTVAVLSPLAFFFTNFVANLFDSPVLVPAIVLAPFLVAPLAVPPLFLAWKTCASDYTLELKRNFARLAAWCYFVMFYSLGALLFFRATQFSFVGMVPPFVMMSLAFAVFLFAAINYTSIRHPAAGWSPFVIRVAVGALAGGLALAAVPGVEVRQSAANESSAIQSMRAIALAEQQYFSAHPALGFAPSLELLGPRHGGWIDPQLASGQKDAYEFRLIRNDAANATQGSKKFVLLARPRVYQQSAIRSFYMDDTGVIHFTSENRLATVADPVSK